MDIYLISKFGWDDSCVIEAYQDYKQALKKTNELNEHDKNNPFGYTYRISRIEVK